MIGGLLKSVGNSKILNTSILDVLTSSRGLGVMGAGLTYGVGSELLQYHGSGLEQFYGHEYYAKKFATGQNIAQTILSVGSGLTAAKYALGYVTPVGKTARRLLAPKISRKRLQRHMDSLLNKAEKRRGLDRTIRAIKRNPVKYLALNRPRRERIIASYFDREQRRRKSLLRKAVRTFETGLDMLNSGAIFALSPRYKRARRKIGQAAWNVSSMANPLAAGAALGSIIPTPSSGVVESLNIAPPVPTTRLNFNTMGLVQALHNRTRTLYE